MVVEAEAEAVESAEATRIRAPVISATGVGSVTIRMAANDSSYFQNAQDRVEVVGAAAAVAGEVIREDAAAVGMVVAVAAVEGAVAVAEVGVYANSTILPRVASLVQIAPSAMTELLALSSSLLMKMEIGWQNNSVVEKKNLFLVSLRKGWLV